MDSTCHQFTLQFPRNYQVLEILGEGGFGTVVKCRKKDTKETVAVKVPKLNQDTRKEIAMLKQLKCLNLDQCNIAKYFGSFSVDTGKALVFEALDINIYDYIVKSQCAPMLLSDIRNITKQMATALNALKSIEVIHTDIKPDNIMLVDQENQPMEAKLIDFGLALPRKKAIRGMSLSTMDHRSPEILLGLPISEATDMWSLGCVVAAMITGGTLIPAENQYEALRYIVDIVGKPADHLLDDGLYTSMYFTKTRSNSWRLMTPEEFGINHKTSGYMDPEFSLDDLKNIRNEGTNKTEAEEREQCIELLKAMLKIDATERITPVEVLAHPFITMALHGAASGRIQMDSNEDGDTSLQALQSMAETMLGVATKSEELDCELPATALNEDTTNIQWDHSGSTPTVRKTGVTGVQPVPAMNKTTTEDEESDDSLQALMRVSETIMGMATRSEEFDCVPPATALRNKDTIQSEEEGAEEGAEEEAEEEEKEVFQASGLEKKKKKKNCFRRFCSWMKKTFCSCWTCPIED